MSKNVLQKELENQRFEHAVSYVEHDSHGLKKLTTTELAHLNNILTGENSDPWRAGSVQVKIPTGHVQNFNMISNPMMRAREILGDAAIVAGNGDLLEACVFLYTTLVTEHLFTEANRRTAALAVYWTLCAHNTEIDIHQLLKIPVGNLRQESDRQNWINEFKKMI